MLLFLCCPGAVSLALLTPPASHAPLLRRHQLLNLRLWAGGDGDGGAEPSVQLQQLLPLWSQLAQGDPLLVRILLPPSALLHHVRRRFFSGGSARGQRRAASVAEGLEQGEERSEQPRLPQRGQHPLPPVASAPGPLHEQGAGPEAAAEAAELRRDFLRLAATLMAATAAAQTAAGGARDAAAPAPPPTLAAARDEGLAADLQSALSLLGDCCTSLTAGGGGAAGDAALLQELLTLVLLPLLRRDSLARLPLLAALHRQGGPALLLPLLRLEPLQLRLLGLRAITASLDGAAGSGGSSASARASRSLSPPPLLGLPRQESGEVIAAAGQLLAGFPLTAATRIVLFELLCDGLPWQQVGCPSGGPCVPCALLCTSDSTSPRPAFTAPFTLSCRADRRPGAAWRARGSAG